jgi:hypothetical protein
MSNVIRLPSVPALSWDDCRNLGAEKIKGS